MYAHPKNGVQIQRKFLGSEECPSPWKFQYSKSKDTPLQIDAVKVCSNAADLQFKIDYIIETAIT
jgi:hypothetical protein